MYWKRTVSLPAAESSLRKVGRLVKGRLLLGWLASPGREEILLYLSADPRWSAFRTSQPVFFPYMIVATIRHGWSDHAEERVPLLSEDWPK